MSTPESYVEALAKLLSLEKPFDGKVIGELLITLAQHLDELPRDRREQAVQSICALASELDFSEDDDERKVIISQHVSEMI